MLLEPPVSRAPYPPPAAGAIGVRVLLFGATSITGYAITRIGGAEVVAVASRAALRRSTWRSIDAEDGAAVADLIRCERPEVVIWAHAVCDVAKCEADPAWAAAINVRGIDNLLRCLPRATRLLYVSSDHVFGNDGVYVESSAPCPISVYGRTRVAAEEMVLQRRNALVVRPGLAIGPSANGRSGFFDWLRYRHERGLPVSVVADESRCAMWADDVAARILLLARSGVDGLRHVAGERAVPRPDLARALLERQGVAPRFEERTRAEQPAPHLGRIELRTIYDDRYAAPLPSVV